MTLRKDLRVSHDYVALDLVDDRGHIVKTPVYLPLNKPVTLIWLNLGTDATYNGEDIELIDIGMTERA